MQNLDLMVTNKNVLKEASERFGDPAFLDSLLATDL